MDRPSKKQIKEALDKLKAPPMLNGLPQAPTPQLPDKKPNKNRIRKQGV